MIDRIFQRAVRVVKGRELDLDSRVPYSYLVEIALLNMVALARGMIRLREKVLLGRHVRLLGKTKMRLSKGVAIGDFCCIDSEGIDGISIGSGSSIGAFSFLKVSGTLTDLGKGIHIGSNVGIGEFAHIGGAGGVDIGDDTIAGAYLSIHPENHVFNDTTQPIRQQGITRNGIRIGRNCWIGAKVTILDGAVIGSNSVIAAGAVVKGEFPEGVIIGGVPAKLLGEI